ncbi:hypothetical protein [Streptomyces sp. NPDC051173]|uniref:hypothetical protein n=1 Tax=Streptomyces sp. NPDC051173 TaxID=3155164 RepID=UPI00344E1296
MPSKPVDQAVVDLYICGLMDDDKSVIQGVLEACCEWDQQHPEFDGAAMAQIHEAHEQTMHDATR